MNNLKGKKFDRLTILEKSDKRCGGHIIWVCICDCGNICEVIGNNLIRGKQKSCGCLKIEKTIKKNWRHGYRRTRLYITWIGMKSRCFGKDNHHKNYRIRGIKICDEWKDNFVVFRNWAIKSGYEGDLVIDRINNNDNYNPRNCHWMTKSEHSRKTNLERRIPNE